MTLRDGTGREVGGGIGMGKTCEPKAFSFQCMTKFTTNKKKKERKLWYTYTMEYYSAIKKNSFESVLRRWMELEPIIQSEVSQKDKDHYNILTHIYGI